MIFTLPYCDDYRRRLFNMMNSLPTIHEVVTGTAKKQSKEKSSHSSSRSKSNSNMVSVFSRDRSWNTFPCFEISYFSVLVFYYTNLQTRVSESQTKIPKAVPPKEVEDSGAEDGENEEELENTLCGACGDNYANDEFWICCDICEKWFHGRCVKITPARAEHIKHYKCPSCSTNKRIKLWNKMSLGYLCWNS